ncbi:MAG: hypothetical protein ABWY93_18785 [Mycobacterium sp.]
MSEPVGVPQGKLVTVREEDLIAGHLAAGYKIPTDFVRAGLVYTRQDDGVFYHCVPSLPFVVDGIDYDVERIDPQEWAGPMFKILDDVLFFTQSEGSCAAHMNHRRPPSEKELDWWVKAAWYVEDLHGNLHRDRGTP